MQDSKKPAKASPKLAKLLQDATPEQRAEALKVTAKLLTIRARMAKAGARAENDRYPEQPEQLQIGSIDKAPLVGTFDPPPPYWTGKHQGDERRELPDPLVRMLGEKAPSTIGTVSHRIPL